ncbi:unnamed protein product [Zymoseptoria tritici ST99CH_3D1]|uniref:Uncharacterized protein n=1 Tax=Zymoseptoria tritici ST99CH_1E4 TaxID=1276532 RepID=A0A2H1H3T1_ZYMTR|nr:unnamed protein product [Zymoseptoria tritici ST99CH_1E4]SMR63603.1 unnamed protein product [Zymoseptoria tritici ST99CH_3D1]
MATTTPNSHNKPCTLCGVPRPVLVRCKIDETAKWHMVCPGKCWISVSGGQEDARGHEAEHPFYKYGGMWKNKHADGPVSAKKPAKVKRRQKEGRDGKKGGGDGQSTDQGGEGEVEGDHDHDDLGGNCEGTVSTRKSAKAKRRQKEGRNGKKGDGDDHSTGQGGDVDAEGDHDHDDAGETTEATMSDDDLDREGVNGQTADVSAISTSKQDLDREEEADRLA